MNRHGRKGSVEMPGVVAGNNNSNNGGSAMPAAAAANVTNFVAGGPASNINFNEGASAGGGEYSNDFALPSLGKQGGAAAVSQLSGRNNAVNGVTSNFSSRKRDAARQSLSDSDFDF